MAILEINLEKPALVEEYRPVGESRPRRSPPTSDTRETRDARETSDTRESSDSGGGRGKLLGALVLLVGVAVVAWRLKSRGSDEYESDEYEHGPDPDIGADENGGVNGKMAGVVGLVVALVSVVALVRRVRR